MTSSKSYKSEEHTHFMAQLEGGHVDDRVGAVPGPVPARYVRHSQMCPQLDVSDKNDQKTQDMSDKARFVRQK